MDHIDDGRWIINVPGLQTLCIYKFGIAYTCGIKGLYDFFISFRRGYGKCIEIDMGNIRTMFTYDNIKQYKDIIDDLLVITFVSIEFKNRIVEKYLVSITYYVNGIGQQYIDIELLGDLFGAIGLLSLLEKRVFTIFGIITVLEFVDLCEEVVVVFGQ